MNAEESQSQEYVDPVVKARRLFLSLFCVGLGAIVSAVVAVPIVGFILTPLLRKVPPMWRKVSGVNDLKVGDTVEVSFQDSSPLAWAGITAKTAAWLRRESENEFIAFSVNCTHLACPVRWVPDAELFMCPCHGGVYYKDGRVASGPPPQALFRYQVRVQDGEVQVQTSGIPTSTH
jgi:menaquinol-cytochrome c reductase iron-sulfur subunit